MYVYLSIHGVRKKIEEEAEMIIINSQRDTNNISSTRQLYAICSLSLSFSLRLRVGYKNGDASQKNFYMRHTHREGRETERERVFVRTWTYLMNKEESLGSPPRPDSPFTTLMHSYCKLNAAQLAI